MKYIIFLLLSTFGFCQEITKKELKELINNSIKEYSKNNYSSEHTILTNNQDSIFYNSNEVELFTSSLAKDKNEFCRTVEFRFYKNGKVNLIDCQSSEEPPSCYVTKDQNVYNYRIVNMNGEIFLNLKNKYIEMNFLVKSKEKLMNDKRVYYKISLLKQ
ncbi:hypothetical protein SAMN05443634_104156 [Chishuiella changwenlii]|uniref:Uncharacterized protein n=1 Tax=Chishuiella changwenlii TaxID=1434701 RepID=A0A1M6W471_9FLAO|nr:hypothetical protein [Chishuiella changwenlii]GGE89050.1 hypothetical protein GCM10010984_03370 [Chishuiella changwenlii]SHK88503.1 hypothetical protein SAMN05443634_104156 [Chishuiella changwenlii]